MAYSDIKLEQGDGLAIITLNRPERLNSLSRHGLEEIRQALDTVEADGTLKVLILTGAPRPDGRPCFSAGLDVREIAEKGLPPLARSGSLGEAALEGMAVVGPVENAFMALCDRLESFPRPTIAAVDGICTGGGLELAMCCDFRIAAETALISDLHLKNLGVVGGGGNTVRLTHLVGPAKAKEIIFMGEPIDGREAHRIGLANVVAPPAELMAKAREWGGKMVSLSASGLRLAKASIAAALDMDRRDALRYSYACWAATAGNIQEQAQAFTSRRPERQ
ncbi:MAG: enoyl-CoA hydratase/isomerase family protein [Chloroflexi bacterium]|nr:enoyl-CoA hydratase/isomerase family protein [Chloroflexota bacterium]